MPPFSSPSCCLLSGLFPVLPLPAASLPTSLPFLLLRSARNLPQAWGISLPLKLCIVCNPQQQVQSVEWRWQSPDAASDPSPGPAILILRETPCHPPIPLCIYVQLLLTNGLPRTKTSDSFSGWKNMKTCHDGLPARQTPVSPWLIHTLAHYWYHLQQERRALPQQQDPGLDGYWPPLPLEQAVPRAPAWPQAPGSGAHVKPELSLNITVAHGET